MTNLCLSVRPPLVWPEFRSSPNGSKGSVYGLRPNAFALESGLLSHWTGLPLPVSVFCEPSLNPKPRFLKEQQVACFDDGSQSSFAVSVATGELRRLLERSSIADLSTGIMDVRGWKVLLRDSREVVGVVDEIIHLGSADSDEIFESVLKLVWTSGPEDLSSEGSLNGNEDSEEMDYLEFLVPLVEDIVKEVDVENNRLFITPPEGLLELARIPQLLKGLEPKLLEFCRHQNDGIRGCLNSTRSSMNRRFPHDANSPVSRSKQERFDFFMPTRRQLIAAGRHELVEDIRAAGGFLAVAQALNLPSRRRPNGFWEDMRNLDAEIEWFVSGNWTKEEDPETGEPVYFNHATGEILSQEPSPGSVSNPVPVSQDSFDMGTAVMPRQRKVLEAGRYDLHHAILAHGGYKLVARELGRQPVSKDTKFVKKIKSFMEEQAMTYIPSFEELRAYGRHDLAYLLRRQGGINAVSDMMDIRPKRYGKGQWSDIDVAAAAIRAYLCDKLILERGLDGSSVDRPSLQESVWNGALRSGDLVIPSQSGFLKEDRPDLRYLLQKFGRKQLAQHLRISFAARGRKVVCLKW